MTDLQDVLGRHHDAVVTEDVLERTATEQPGSGHHASLVGLIEQLEGQEHAEERTYRAVLRRVEQSGARRWLR
jgi:CHAD domain-containing protein